ncbi:MAG: Rieske (2Fe-2S) protein [Deltaproteobacteria bacterium]|nr:MAG: Rieske (2Fe-2S) protein [Deltaproteobacteria bacterium]
MASGERVRVAVYRREVAASLERVLENVRDWEHLPWLHRSSFAGIERLDAGSWGWRARVAMQPAGVELIVEVRIDPDGSRYVTRTVEGPGAGTEIWTDLELRAASRTGIRVEFRVPDVAPQHAADLGAAYVRLYTRLWDEDESMMVERQARLAERPRRSGADPEPLDLGPLDSVRARLPLRVAWGGRSYRVVDVDGELRAHATVCPHWLGPLDAASVEADGSVRCPWHGYRFDVRTGRSCDGRALRLDRAPRVCVDPETSRVRLDRASPSPSEERGRGPAGLPG